MPRGVRSPEGEWNGAALGDSRLTNRLKLIGRRACEAPGASFPVQCGSLGELEATYRFLSNERVKPAAVLGPHVEGSRRRMEGRARVLVAHDTTELRFEGEREGLGDLSGGGRGFVAHVALALTDDDAREPLGVLHIESIVRRGPPKRTSGKRRKSEDSEALRWHRGVEAVAATVPAGVQAVHLMDREGDAYALLAMMVEQEQDFVVRGCYDRITVDGKLRSLLAVAPVRARREVPLTRRAKQTNVRREARHPARSERSAHLEVRGLATEMVRPSGEDRGPHSLPLNVVHVSEPCAPEGEPAVEWFLWTTLPISSHSELLAVVDAYRARWVIEEYFKALKTGCAIERRQLESAHALQNTLAVFAPVAWLLLRLRSIARARPSSQGTSLLSARQLTLLRALALRRRHQLAAAPDARAVMLALAAVGGHLPNNGDPGWQVLGRGLDALLSAEITLAAIGM